VTEWTREQNRLVGTMSPGASTPATTLRGRWLVLGRVAWVAVAILTAVVFVSGLPSEFARLRVPCADVASCAWVPRLTADDARELGELGLSTDFFAAYFVALEVALMAVSCAIGTAVFWRKSDDWMALLVSLMLFTLGAALTVPYPLVDLPLAWEVSGEAVSFIGSASLVLFLYLFPDGRFVPRWTRWLALVWIVGLMVPATFFYDPFLRLFGATLTSAFAGVGFGGTSLLAQAYRYRRVSDPSQRQQTKWVFFGAVTALGGSCVLLLLGMVVPRNLFASLVGTTVLYLLVLLIPVSIAIAVLRYHLYDIDIIINRALVYGTLTVLLAGVYAGTIVLLQEAFRALTGQQSGLAIVASTLVIAGLFTPLRRRIQSFIDRRFYRRKYDARKTLEAFSLKLRDETDLDAVSDDLVGVVRETMQPAHVSLWLRTETASKGKQRGQQHPSVRVLSS
jgi:hypothetical protein